MKVVQFRLGGQRPIAKTAQGIVQETKRLTDCCNYTMHNLIWLLTARIAHYSIPARKDCWPKDRFVQFLGPSSHCPLEMRKIVLEVSVG